MLRSEKHVLQKKALIVDGSDGLEVDRSSCPVSVQYCTVSQIGNVSRLCNSAQPPPFLSARLGLSKDLHARTFKWVIPMGRQRLSRLLLLPIVPLTLLVFPARLIWTQERPSTSETPIQFSGLAGQFVAVPEAKIRFHPLYENLSPPFAPKQGQTPSQMRFRTFAVGYHLPSIKNNALPELWQLAKTDEVQAKANHFISNTPIEWLTVVNTNNKVHFRTPDPGGNAEYYGRRIPWAGRVILGIGKQAKFHPRVTRVLEVIKPGLDVGKPPPTGGSAGPTRVVGRGPFR